MTKRTRNPIVLALLIAVVLAGAALIVSKNNSTMTGGRGETPSGVIH